MFDFLFDFFGGTEHHTDNITVFAIKKKAASLDDVAPLKDISGNISSYDTNGDGWITAADSPYIPGSAQAKLFWQHVITPALKMTKSLPEAIPYQQEYGNNFHGFYGGKAVISGHHESPGNVDYIQDRLQTVQGFSKAGAQQVSDFINRNLVRT